MLFLVHHDVFRRATSGWARVVLLTTAAASFGVAWVVMSAALGHASPSSASALRLAASALPNAAVLIVPACIPASFLRGQLVAAPSRRSRVKQ